VSQEPGVPPEAPTPARDPAPGPEVPPPGAGAPGIAPPLAPGTGSSPRTPQETIRALRESRRKQWRLFKIFSISFFALFMTVAILHWALSNYFHALYFDQPWITITSTYRKIDMGMVLAINREEVILDLEQRFQGKDAYAIGTVTRVETPDPPADGEGPGSDSPGMVAVRMDVLHFDEDVNLFDDEIHVEILPASLEGIATRDLVIAKGKVKNFSRFGLWLENATLRPLNAVERWYIQKALPPTRLTREPIGFNRMRGKKGGS
jgi:hypothetical protein